MNFIGSNLFRNAQKTLEPRTDAQSKVQFVLQCNMFLSIIIIISIIIIKTKLKMSS